MNNLQEKKAVESLKKALKMEISSNNMLANEEGADILPEKILSNNYIGHKVYWLLYAWLYFWKGGWGKIKNDLRGMEGCWTDSKAK